MHQQINASLHIMLHYFICPLILFIASVRLVSGDHLIATTHSQANMTIVESKVVVEVAKISG